MSDALSALEYGGKTAKRATWEAFAFDVPSPGLVVVTNESYGDEKDEHVHTVNVDGGVPTSCSCKADEYQEGACKHRVAVAIAEPVLEAAGAEPERAVATDGGQVLEPETGGSSDETTHAPGCDNPECEGFDADGRPLLSFECWEVWA